MSDFTSPNIFKAYDIRGLVENEITPDFSFRVGLAFARFLEQEREPATIVIGEDMRPSSPVLADAFSAGATSNGMDVIRIGLASTDMLYFASGKLNMPGAMFTASHNPAEYNGIKFSRSSGGPALPETTNDIERRANEMAGQICYKECSLAEATKSGLLVEIDPMPAYLSDLAQKVDFSVIAKLGTLAVNPLYGTARGYLAEPLQAHGVQVVQMNANRDPYFGGFPPEPSEKYIQDFIKLVQQDPEIHLGIATDGDADRFGIVDGDGSFIEPNYIIALLLDYLVRVKGMTGGVGRSVATSHLIDAVAKLHGVEVFETPVGFKYIGELISQDKIIIGGEESAGLTIKGHVPEKDGILACLLVAEMVAHEGMSVKALLERLYAKVGRYLTKRVNLTLSPELEAVFPERIAATPSSFAGVSVRERITVDGNKFILEDGSWLLFRKSGTEPVVRLYCEASSEERLQALVQAGREFIVGKQ